MPANTKDPLRPKTLAEFLGQDQIKEVLQTALTAAKERKEPLDHILLNGPPGLGKTTLANIIANELGWKISPIIGASITNTGDARSFLYGRPKNTVLFIDEIHRMRRPIQELFYPVLEDGKLQFGGGVQLDLPPMTIIGATTNMGKLDQPFIDRFPLQFQLQYYDEKDLAEILRINAKKLAVNLLVEGIEAIALRARGTPRIANNLLRRLRDFAQVARINPVDEEYVEMVLDTKLHVDPMGLDDMDRKYLETVDDTEGIGLDAISKAISQSSETVEDYTEPYLIRLGFIERKRNGRWLTAKGEKYLTKRTKG